MQVAISSSGDHFDAPVSPIFGRCECFLIADTETLETIASPNPAVSAMGGAGVQSAQWVVRQGVKAVLSGNVGPKAMAVLDAAGIPVYAVQDGTAREALRPFVDGALHPLSQPSVAADHGKPIARPGEQHDRRERPGGPDGPRTADGE